MNNRLIESTIRHFFKEYLPRQDYDPEPLVQDAVAKGMTPRQALEHLYKTKIESRYIPLKQQRNEGIYYPLQRTSAWFKERKRVPSTVTGSRPAGWWFDIKSKEAYQNHLDYLHNGKKQTFDKAALARMQYGVKFEDHAMMTFLEWGVSKLCSDMYVYETGFQRNTSYQFLGASPDGLVTEFFAGIIVGARKSIKFEDEMDYLLRYKDCDGVVATLVIAGTTCFQTAINASFDEKDAGQLEGLELEEPPSGWQRCRHFGKRAKGAKHSILEIKCPQKMYSNIPAYYLMQLHMECHAYGLRDAYFVVWNRLNDKERLRVWKFRFNDGFWKSFMTLVDSFRALRSDGKRGAPWANFEPLMWHFKKNYGRVSVWDPFVRAYHARGEFALNRPYANALNKVPEDKAQ